MKKMIIIIFALIVIANIATGKDENKLKNDLKNDLITLNEEKDASLVIEKWMLNDSIWNIEYELKEYECVKSNNNTYEHPLIVEDWMLNDKLFNK